MAFGKQKQAANKPVTNKNFDIIICNQSTVNGNIESAGSVRIDGQLTGDIACGGRVIVGEHATINGKIQAETVEISGVVNGDIALTGGLKLLASASLMGNVTAMSLDITDGATFAGNCQIGAQTQAINQQKIVPETYGND